MKTVRFAVCGAGCRGTGIGADLLPIIPGAEVIAVHDPYTDKAENFAKKVEEKVGKAPKVYNDYIEMFEGAKPDAVLVVTSWCDHVKVAVAAMEHGIATALEVGGAYSEEECWELVNTYERTKTPFMFMENCCYGKYELFVNNLVRKGKLGEIVYCHGAYTHDLRDEVCYGDVNRHYRLEEYTNRNRENYPTHELGPIAKILNINRGNRLVSLSSLASPARGMNAFANKKDDLVHMRDRKFKQGDVVETIIKCENGELISIKLATGIPTYYSRELYVNGTDGMFNQELDLVMIDGDPHEFDMAKNRENLLGSAQKYMDEFLPDIWKNVTIETIEAGHGGMDFFVYNAFCEALRNGDEMPIDVYDAATWMSIAYLSEQSIANGGAAVEIPDFTRGAYKTRPQKDVIEF